MRAWAYRDPDAIATFALELYENGSSYIGDYKVKVCKELLNSTWMQKNYNAPITAAVWMICGALANTVYDIFEGSPGDDSSTRTSRLAEWLKKTNQYSDDPKAHTRHVWGWLLGKPCINHALTLKPDSHTDVILSINTKILLKITSTPSINLPPSYKGGVHWVMLNKPIFVVNDKVHMDIWTWSKNIKLVISEEQFNKHYYGSIIAYSDQPKRNIPQGSIQYDFFDIH